MTDSWPPTTATLVGRLFGAELELMDRQVLDCDGSPITVVDDVELSADPDQPLSGADPPPVITALLAGAVVGTRIFGGRPPTSRLERITWTDAEELGTVVRLRVPRAVLDVGWQERWVAEHIIGRIPGPIMILSEVIGAPVVDGRDRVGRVADLRFLLDEEGGDEMPTARLYGILVSRHSASSFLGYERSGVNRPWPLAQLLRWRERDSFLILWADVQQLSRDGVLLRPGARRWSTRLPPRTT